MSYADKQDQWREAFDALVIKLLDAQEKWLRSRSEDAEEARRDAWMEMHRFAERNPFPRQRS